MEPFEEVIITIPEEMAGIIIEKLSKRRGNMLDMRPDHGNVN